METMAAWAALSIARAGFALKAHRRAGAVRVTGFYACDTL